MTFFSSSKSLQIAPLQKKYKLKFGEFINRTVSSIILNFLKSCKSKDQNEDIFFFSLLEIKTISPCLSSFLFLRYVKFNIVGS